MSPPAVDPPRPEARIGSSVAGSFVLTKVLGTGGMGAVYEAQHALTGKKVAIKLLAPQLSKDLKLVARFRREALAASRLDHENCVHVDDFGEDSDGTFYIVMEHVAGRGLAEELRATGPMPPTRVARIGVQLFKGLDAAHVAGVLHRDLKPQNVMLTSRPGRVDIVKVVDFGIAKLTTNEPGEIALTVPGTIFGTPEYMSPEQARGEHLDARSDLYSASVVLWHMLLGRSPFRGTSVRDTLIKVFAEDAPSPLAERPGLALPPGFEDVLRRGLAKNRDDRWADAASMAAALARFTDGALVELPPRVVPGLNRDGAPQAATLDKLPASSIAPSSSSVAAAANEVTKSLATPRAPPVSAPEVPRIVTSVVSPDARTMPSSSRPQPSHASSPMPMGLATVPLSAVELASLIAPPPPQQQPPPATIVDDAPPKMTRVVTLDSVKQQTNTSSSSSSSVVTTARRRKKTSSISVAAVVVIVGATVLLCVALLLGFLVATDRLGPSTSTSSTTSSTTTSPTPTSSASPSTSPPTTAAPSPVSAALLGDVVVDAQARDAALGRAERAVAAGDKRAARVAYEEAVRADPTAPTALAGLGTIAMQQRDWVTARDAFEKLISIDNAYRKQFGPMYARARRFVEQPPPD